MRCPGCGAILMPPPPGVPQFSSSAGAAAPATELEPDDVGFNFQQLQSPPPAPGPPADSPPAPLADSPPIAAHRGVLPPTAPTVRPTRSWIGSAIGAAGVAAGIAIAIFLPHRAGPPSPAPRSPAVAAPASQPAPDRVDAGLPDLIAQKQRADALALSGQYPQASDAYASLLRSLAAHPSNNPILASLVAATCSAQNQVLAARLKSISGPAPAATQPAVEPAPPPLVLSPPPTRPASAPPNVAAAPQEPATTAPDQFISTRPPVQSRTYYEPNAVTDEQIGDAIHRGVMFLQRAFRNGQIQVRDEAITDNYNGALSSPGIDALCVYAMLHAGQAVNEPWLTEHSPFTQQMLAALKQYRLDFTYHRSLRAAALAVYHRPEDLAQLEDDTLWLLRACHGGAYSYTADLAQSGGVPFGPGMPVYSSSPQRSSAPGSAAGGSVGRGEVIPAPGVSIVGGSQVISGRSMPIAPLPPGVPLVTNSSSGQVRLSNGQTGGWSSSSGPGLSPAPSSQSPGQYGYGAAATPIDSFDWDNSNSQYGLLGVWSGADAGVAVPAAYWQQVQQHWLSCQLANGAWGYVAGSQPTLSMTDAGLASLLVSSDWLARSGVRSPGAQAAIDRTLASLDQGDNAVATLGAGGWYGYSLYGLERVGLASGYRFFGNHDWYAEFAKHLVLSQHGDGSWGPAPPTYETAIDTAYALLFLSRGRHPVLMNKLRFAGDWNDHPHDLSSLARFASAELQRPINWQVINTASDWTQWLDCPVLYIASDQAPRLNAHDLDQLRQFALAGGIIFTQADSGSYGFNRWAVTLARTLFPQWRLGPLEANHPLYSTLFPINSRQIPLLGVSNGSRLVFVHCSKDLADTWDRQWSQSDKVNFQFAVNLFIYANGKTNLLHRLQTSYIPPWTAPTQQTDSVLRVSYDGTWNPEPYAWTRFQRYFAWETSDQLNVKTEPLAHLAPTDAPLAVMSGCDAHGFGDDEVAAVQRFVDGGGILLVDACGGSSAFAASVRDLLGRAFPGVPLLPIAPTHPLLLASRPGADDLTKPMLRPYAMEQLGPKAGALVLKFGKGQVIFSPLDITTGLLGTNTWPIDGYDPAYAAALVKNAILWTDASAANPAGAPVPAMPQ